MVGCYLLSGFGLFYSCVGLGFGLIVILLGCCLLGASCWLEWCGCAVGLGFCVGCLRFNWFV